MKKILVIHGPNLNLLGKRETDIYGKVTIDEINRALKEEAKALKIELSVIQSNHEGGIVDEIGKASNAFDGIL
ncbi:MAG: type II 3-dehydroquinate dehydratase, partial [Candidatus Omnitrophica bacterium]|nr:type II 3-dehydroquinate dehydratase [Candidatus Omnitrophota bacterium]